MKHLFSSKYEMFSKSIETRSIFTKTELSNKENVYFLQHIKCEKKKKTNKKQQNQNKANKQYKRKHVRKLKLDLPKQKRTMNETLNFL